MIHKKLFLTLFLTFFLTCCPKSDEEIYVHINSLTTEANCVSQTNSCEEVFKIYLNFDITETVLTANNFNTGFYSYGTAYASQAPSYYLENEVVACNIINLSEFDGLPSGSSINDYFKATLNDNTWTNNISSMTEAINQSLIAIATQGDYPLYLKEI